MTACFRTGSMEQSKPKELWRDMANDNASRSSFMNSRSKERTKRGFTLVELLVVVAIIGLLAAMLFPAVQAARESGRRSQCANNMRQYGIAVLNYESANGRLPGFSDWTFAVRDFVELQSSTDRKTRSEFAQGRAFGSPIATCPSVPGTERDMLDYGPTEKLWVAPTRDGGSRVDQGAWAKTARLAKVLDGLSNTFLLAEQAGLPILYWGRPANHEDGPWPKRRPVEDEDVKYRGETGVFPIYFHHEKGASHSVYSGMQINCKNHGGLYAFHTGATVTMCDGSVHFKSTDTDPEILAMQFSRDRGRQATFTP